MPNKPISPGRVIGNWTVVEILPVSDGVRRVRARCAFCGGEKDLRYSNLSKTYSCGCAKRQYAKAPKERAERLGDRDPCAGCETYDDDCPNWRECSRYRKWFRAEWAGIRAAVHANTRRKAK